MLPKVALSPGLWSRGFLLTRPVASCRIVVMNQTYITCFVCHNARTIPVSEDQLIEWKMSGQFVQDFFPDLNVNDRELLISGVCGQCFDRIIPDDDDDQCSGVCMTAADIGLPEYGSQVAYAHPDCPEHGGQDGS